MLHNLMHFGLLFMSLCPVSEQWKCLYILEIQLCMLYFEGVGIRRWQAATHLVRAWAEDVATLKYVNRNELKTVLSVTTNCIGCIAFRIHIYIHIIEDEWI